MDIDKIKGIIESILFASGKEVNVKQISSILEISVEEVNVIIDSMKNDYEVNNRGIEIIKVNDAYQLCTKKEYYEYVYELFDKGLKPNLSQAALEILSIIAYNPRITKAEVENLRGVNSDGTIYKMLEYELIEESGKLDILGKPMSYKVSNNFYRMFGITSMEELPELPKYRVDENQQIIMDDLVTDDYSKEQDENTNYNNEENTSDIGNI